MFAPRMLQARPDWQATDGIKRYAISAGSNLPHRAPFEQRLGAVLAVRPEVDWQQTPAFAIFHAGSSRNYLTLAWWAAGNELFFSVSVEEEGGWVEDPARYSFCLHDMEVLWGERQLYLAMQLQGEFDLAQWRQRWYHRVEQGA